MQSIWSYLTTYSYNYFCWCSDLNAQRHANQKTYNIFNIIRISNQCHDWNMKHVCNVLKLSSTNQNCIQGLKPLKHNFAGCKVKKICNLILWYCCRILSMSKLDKWTEYLQECSAFKSNHCVESENEAETQCYIMISSFIHESRFLHILCQFFMLIIKISLLLYTL